MRTNYGALLHSPMMETDNTTHVNSDFFKELPIIIFVKYNVWFSLSMFIKAELLREGIIFLIHLFARSILLMKKLKIEETKAT